MQNYSLSVRFIEKCFFVMGVFALFIAAAVTMPQFASAHTNPGGCNATGVNLSLIVYEADGVTPLGAGVAAEGDTLKYQATLAHAGGTNCNYQGGTLTITTPDGAVTDVAGGVIPLISAGTPFVSQQVTYVATAADVGGDNDLDAFATYANGTSHLGGDVTPVGATAPAATPFVESLQIEKTVVTTFDRAWTWEITKSADQTDLLLGETDTVAVNYEVEVTPTSDDSNHMVSGVITVTNPSGNVDATITDVTDVLDNSGGLTVDCGVVFPYVLAGGAELECTYSGASDGTDTENTATVITSGDVPGAETTEDVAFSSDPTTETDECVTVNDTNSQFPADTVVCADDADKTIEYSVDFGPNGDVVTACGEGSHPNVADFITNDTQATGEDDETVTWTVECQADFCSLSQGYWFAKPKVSWGDGLELGGNTYTKAEGDAIWKASNKGGIADSKQAFTQYAAIMLTAEQNGTVGDIPAELQAYLDTIEEYFTGKPKLTPSNLKTPPFGSDAALKAAAGSIGGWIDENHCED